MTKGYRAADEEYRKIDEALAAVRRGEIESGAEVEAVFAKHHKASGSWCLRARLFTIA